jgi:hypothetical protein
MLDPLQAEHSRLDDPPKCDYCDERAEWTCQHRAHCQEHRKGCTCWDYDRHASQGKMLARRDARITELEANSARRDDLATVVRADVAAAAGELRVDMTMAPPGSLVAQLLIANRLLRAQLDASKLLALRFEERVREVSESGCTTDLVEWSRADLREALSCTAADRCSACRCRAMLEMEGVRP